MKCLQGQGTIPTYSEDIACILYSHCTSCHHVGGIAPMSLMTYAEAANYGQAILNMVEGASDKTYHLSTEMPPWPPDRTYQKYAYDPTLSADEIQAIRDWVQNGTPQGNPANAPTPPTYSSQGTIPNPDLTVTIPTYTSTAASNDVYRYFALPSGLTADKYVQQWEVVPGNAEIVHHVLVFVDPTGSSLQDDANDPLPGFSQSAGAPFTSYRLIGGWAPGAKPYTAPTGFGFKIDANSAIVLQIHYPKGSVGQQDSTTIRFKFATTPVRALSSNPILNHESNLTNGPLYIPANSTRTFNESFTLPGVSLTFFSVFPHMHLIGRSIETFGIKPNGDTLKFIRINNWNFSWQGDYHFQRPIKVPAGTVLKSNAFYDNTLNNPFNPNNPPQDVYQGEATGDEMMMTFFTYTFYMNGDENIIVDTSSHLTHYNYCSMTTQREDGSHQILIENKLTAFPNPASELITLLSEMNMDRIELLDYHGRVLSVWDAKHQQSMQLGIGWLPSGCYYLRATFQNGKYSSTTFIKE